MTGRLALRAQLDLAVERRTLTLVQGLPRVGRTRLIVDWMDRRIDAAFCRDLTMVPESDGILVLDHFDQSRVAALVAAVRTADVAGGRTRYVAAPTDLATSFALRDALTGSFDTVDVIPLRLDEVEDPVTSLSIAMGPLAATAIPFDAQPQSGPDPRRHWLRGGFPESLAEPSDLASLNWRRKLLEQLLERDYRRWGLSPGYPLVEVLRWLARRNSAELDETTNQFGKRAELKSAVFVLEKLGIIRRLKNIAALDHPEDSLMDKLFIRDTGLLHALVGVVTGDNLDRYREIGASFESYAIESLIAAAGANCGAQFYRFNSGHGDDEIDLVLDFPDQAGRQIAVEFKVGATKKAEPGFFRACTLLGIDEQLVVHAGSDPYPDERVPRYDLRSAMKRIAEIAAGGQ